MKDLQVIGWLILIRDLLTAPCTWTKYSLAKDLTGMACSPYAERASCFCLYGAICRALPGSGAKHDSRRERAARGIRRAIDDLFPDMMTLTGFNDSPATTHEDVVKVLNRAVELAAGSN